MVSQPWVTIWAFNSCRSDEEEEDDDDDAEKKMWAAKL